MISSRRRTFSAGDLTELVTIQSEIETADDMGGHARDWENVAAVYAAVEPLSGSARDKSGGERSVVQYQVTMYRRDGLSVGMRILWGNQALNITGMPIGPGRDLFMTVIAEAGGGT